MKKAIAILLILSCLCLGVLNFHIILLDSSVKTLKKNQMTFDNTFIDARGNKKEKLLENQVLLDAGFAKLVNHKKTGQE